MKSAINTPFINGFEYSWSNIQILLSGTVITAITSIDYSESADIQKLYGAGNAPIAYGVGNYEAEASITVLASEILAIQESAPNGNIMGIEPFDIVVSFLPSDGQGTPVFDILRNCMFLTNNRSTSQGDASLEISLDLVVSHIDWGQA